RAVRTNGGAWGPTALGSASAGAPRGDHRAHEPRRSPRGAAPEPGRVVPGGAAVCLRAVASGLGRLDDDLDAPVVRPALGRLVVADGPVRSDPGRLDPGGPDP